MQKLVLAVFLSTVIAMSLFTIALANTMGMPGVANAAMMVTPDDIKWMPSKQLQNVQVAIMDGDPKKAGSPYTMRLKLPDGYTIPLHWHPDTERLTILSGTIMFGVGDTMDRSKTTALGPGSYVVIPAYVRHWVTAKGATIFQVSGVAPFTVNFIKQGR
jgi:quercetin dioxygenase-like cupin family protein